MRILVIDANALALDFCLRSMAEGHEVQWFIRNKTPGLTNVGRGLVPKTGEWRTRMSWADLIFVPDNAVYMRDLQPYHDKGYPIYGANDWSARWEMERGTGMDVLDAHGIKTLGGEIFTSYDKAIDYVRSTMGRYVSKPSGDADKALSYVSKGPADMIFMLERWRRFGKLKAPFIIQKFTPGVEMAVGVWCGPDGFASPYCENFEFKKLMNDEKGPATGEQGTCLMYTEKSKLADTVLKPLEKYLKESRHVGYVDVNCIISDDGTPWPLEFTNRPGWPLFNIQEDLHRSTATWMKSSLLGRSIYGNFKTNTIATGIVVSIPDYPYGRLPRHELMGIPIYGLEKSPDSIHPCELMLGKAPIEKGSAIKHEKMLVSAGNYLLVASGTGESVSASARKAYSVAEQISIPNSPMWRTDIGKRLEHQIPKLQAMGYAKNWKY